MCLEEMKIFLDSMGIYGEIVENKICFCASFKSKEENKKCNIYGNFYIFNVDGIEILTSNAIISKLNKVKISDYKTLMLMQDDLVGYFVLLDNFVIYKYDHIYVDKMGFEDIVTFIMYDIMTAREVVESKYGENARYELEKNIDIANIKPVKSKVYAKGTNTIQ